MGRFAQCTDATVLTRAACNGTYLHYLADGSSSLQQRRWENPDTGDFDNVLTAILTLFEMSMLERWPEVMFHAMDAYEVDESPRRDASKCACSPRNGRLP